MSKGLLRNKIADLKLALEGRVTQHHRFLLNEMLDDLRHVGRQDEQGGGRNREAAAPFSR
jgi:hypothetical protein